MGVSSDEQTMGSAARHVEELECFELVAALTAIKSMCEDDWPKLEASTRVFAVWSPVPLLRFRGKRLTVHECCDVAQILRDTPRIAHK